MKFDKRHAQSLLIIAATAVTLTAQSPSQLNPTVRLSERPTATVPAECLEGLAPGPAAPRIEVADSEPLVDRTVADQAPPPRADLRSRLREAQLAADRNDREGLRAALAEAKTLLASYPAGGDRDAASATIRVYDQIERLWVHQFESPTGAFFAEDSDLYRSANAYPGYSEAVRRQVITTGGVRYYPTSETRSFLARAAATRLATLGVRVPTPPSRRTPAPVQIADVADEPNVALPQVRPRRSSPAEPKTTVPPKRSTTRSTSRSTTRSVTKAPSSKSPSSSTPRVATSRPAPPPVKVAEVPPPAVATSKPITEVPAPIPSPVDVPTTTTPVVATTETTEPLATDTSMTAADTAPVTDTATATTEATTSSAPAPATPPSETKGRGVLLPALVVLATVGLLWMLFRASD